MFDPEYLKTWRCGVLREEMLQFVTFQDMVKLALLSKELYTLIDPNRGIIDKTDDKLNMTMIKGKNIFEISEQKQMLSCHFA